ncbi:hypothetical protein P3L51_12300 [Streptomyces sp. PSRA5]|uniref:hypothetical protein n=1 Tax=Streptomyces panacea TaxID=3035064 RepID=UPI00339C8E4B
MSSMVACGLDLGRLGSPKALIVPAAINAFGIFTFVIVPLMIIFLFGARHLIRDIAAGALKG